MPYAALCRTHSHRVDQISKLDPSYAPKVVKLPIQGQAEYFPCCLRCSTPDCLANPAQEHYVTMSRNCVNFFLFQRGALVAAVLDWTAA